jgi:murein DD-endopeptidase MepM/ murein hydrolase activator NlpD
MNAILKGSGSIVLFLVSCALCLSLISVPSCADAITDTTQPPEEPPPPPSSGNCDNVGVSYPDNPFSGWPLDPPNWGLVTAWYCDPDYFQQFGVNHWGLDLAYPTGTAVVATATGTVTAAGWHNLMGLHVRLCADDWCATYMHLSVISVSSGQSMSPGDVLGEVGSTGNSTGPHLHYQINDPASATVDPVPTMP